MALRFASPGRDILGTAAPDPPRAKMHPSREQKQKPKKNHAPPEGAVTPHGAIHLIRFKSGASAFKVLDVYGARRGIYGASASVNRAAVVTLSRRAGATAITRAKNAEEVNCSVAMLHVKRPFANLAPEYHSVIASEASSY
jgi:hypothetical protein